MQSDFNKMPNDIHDFRQNNSSIRNVGSEAWGNKTKEVCYSLLSLKMISFGLFPQASPPRMNFNISKLVYSAKRHATQLKTFKISNVDNQCKTMASRFTLHNWSRRSASEK